jgi:hypothetical protein
VNLDDGLLDSAATWLVVGIGAAPDAGGEPGGFSGGISTVDTSDGTETYTAEYLDPMYPGLVSVRFPEFDPGTATEATLRPYTSGMRIREVRQARFDGLPWSGHRQDRASSSRPEPASSSMRSRSTSKASPSPGISMVTRRRWQHSIWKRSWRGTGWR